MPVAPYPFERLPRVRRADAARLRRFARAAPAGDLDGAGELARTLLGARPNVTPGLPELARASGPEAGDGACVWFLLDDQRTSAPSAAHVAALAIPGAFAAMLVDCALGGDGSSAFLTGATPETSLDEISQGVLGYLAARLLHAHGGGLRLRAVTCDAARISAALAGRPRVVWPARVILGGHEARVSLWLTEDGCAARSPEAKIAGAISRIAVTVCAHAARVVLTRAEVAQLAPGDVVVPERCALARGLSGWHGEVELHVEGARRTRWRGQATGATLRIDAIEIDEELGMTDARRTGRETGTGDSEPNAIDGAAHDTATANADTSEPLALAGDAPVELCVELARFTLPLAELAALRPGEVLSTGRAIGEHVALRAGGRAVAHGELVDVDGELGVRIVQIAKG